MTLKIKKHYIILMVAILISFVGISAYLFYKTSAKPRTLSATPVMRHLGTSIPTGTAEAFFEIDTSETQKWWLSSTEAGLIVVVRYGDTEYRQTFASCAKPEVGIMGVLLDAVTKLQPLEIATCDEKEFWLLSEPGKVSVNHMSSGSDGQEVLWIETPKNIRAMPYERPPEPRALDVKPVKHRLKTPLPAGRAEALFEMVLTGDQMSMTSTEVGLSIIVRHGDMEYRQIFASCRRPSSGSALGGGTERILEVAICNGEFWLISEPGLVSVHRMDKKTDGEEMLRFEIPDKLRAVSGERKR